jgi:hypothetical protein
MINDMATYVDQCMDSAKTRFRDLERQLQQDLAGQEKFYFPASGAFFFKNPRLNNNGDLVCSVSYDANDWALPNPNAAARKDILVGDGQAMPSVLSAQAATVSTK